MNKEEGRSDSVSFCANRLPPKSLSEDFFSSEHRPAGKHDKSVWLISRVGDTRNMLKILLEHWGYHVEDSAHHKEFLSFTENPSPSIILLDTILPFEINLETIREIRHEPSLDQTTIIVMSGFSQPEYRRRCIAFGANYYFVKPLNFELLERFMEKNIEKQSGKAN